MLIGGIKFVNIELFRFSLIGKYDTIIQYDIMHNYSQKTNTVRLEIGEECI